MTPLFPAQRAAEEFDQALGGTAPRVVSDRYATLLETVVVLRSQPEVLPRAEFVGDLRSRLMTAAETELVAAPSVVRHLPPTRTPQRTSRRNRRLGTLAASLVIVGGSAGMAAAAAGSLPGESLYPIKRGVEQAAAAVQFGDAGKGKAELDQAAARLDEVRDLQAQGSPDAALIANTVDSFRSSAEAGSASLFTSYADTGDTGDITTVREFALEQMGEISALSGTSATTDEALLDAADTLATIDQQARALCGTCGPETTLAPPGVFAAAAGAATVDNLLARPVAQARVDISAAEAAQMARLKEAAEKSAGELPRADDLAGKGTDALPTGAGADGPVSSKLTPDGKLLPASSGTRAVKDLVKGVTGGISGVTTTVASPDTPVGSAVEDLTGTVDELTDDLLP